MELWTRRLRLAWRPSLAFYERRYDIMRELEEAGLLRQFKVEDDQVTMRLGDVRHQLVFGPDHLYVAALAPDSDMTRLRTAARVVWAALSPQGVRRSQVGLQWLHALDRSYDDARHEAALHLLPSFRAMHRDDFALYMNGHLDDLAAHCHLEAGVIDADEAGPRLARTYSEPDRDVPPNFWPAESLPPVALFCDQRWSLEQELPLVDDVFAQWETFEGKGEQVSLDILGHLFGGSE